MLKIHHMDNKIFSDLLSYTIEGFLAPRAGII